jgi:hypothetical protein
MLQLLENLLTANGYYFEEELGNIPYSCCPAETKKVLDFDQIKDKFCSVLACNPLKSVDTIYLAKPSNTLYLIEMKSFDPAGTLSCIDFIDKHYGKYAIGNKIADSLFVIFGIIGYYNIHNSFYAYFFNPNHLKIKTFLLTNFSYSDLVSLSLATLDKQKIGLTKRIEGETVIMNCDSFTTHMATV